MEKAAILEGHHFASHNKKNLPAWLFETGDRYHRSKEKGKEKENK